MIILNTINDERIVFYRELRYNQDIHLREKLFLVEGKRNVLKLLNSDLNIVSLLITPEFYSQNQEIIKRKNIIENQIFIADKELTNKIIGFKHHTGIMALSKQPNESPLEEMGNIIIGLNGINNAENVGSIIRNSVAFGINSFIYDKNSCNPFIRRSVRVSMGAIFNIKHKSIHSLPGVFEQLKKNNYSIISIEINQNAKLIDKFNFPNRALLIFGNEANGINDEILKLSDEIVCIPIVNIDSLNVSAASAIVCYEIKKGLSKFDSPK